MDDGTGRVTCEVLPAYGATVIVADEDKISGLGAGSRTFSRAVSFPFNLGDVDASQVTTPKIRVGFRSAGFEGRWRLFDAMMELSVSDLLWNRHIAVE